MRRTQGVILILSGIMDDSNKLTTIIKYLSTADNFCFIPVLAFRILDLVSDPREDYSRYFELLMLLSRETWVPVSEQHRLDTVRLYHWIEAGSPAFFLVWKQMVS